MCFVGIAAQSSDVDVADRNAAVDRVFRCSILQTREHCTVLYIIGKTMHLSSVAYAESAVFIHSVKNK